MQRTVPLAFMGVLFSRVPRSSISGGEYRGCHCGAIGLATRTTPNHGSRWLPRLANPYCGARTNLGPSIAGVGISDQPLGRLQPRQPAYTLQRASFGRKPASCCNRQRRYLCWYVPELCIGLLYLLRSSSCTSLAKTSNPLYLLLQSILGLSH
jgi:hypothetical protein